MYVMYNGEHSVIFENEFGEERHTWNDWQLLPVKKPTVAMPGVSTTYVDIPGRNGSIDVSNYLTGGIVFSDRSGSWEFKVIGTENGSWDDRMTEISEFLHGHKCKIILVDDPDYYYEGRITISDKNTDGKIPAITLSYRVGPFKTERYGASGTF